MRAATQATVAFAWVSFVLRMVQLGSIYTQHEGISKGAYVLATFCILCMLLIEIAKESADIIHEMIPTEDQQGKMGAEIFTHNYDMPTGSG